MILYFLRHGEADWPDWNQPDDARPLTKKGKEEIRRVANFLRNLGVTPARILASPLPRARQTAEIVADYLKAELREEPSLAGGFNLSKLKQILKSNPAEELMIVGHEPAFSSVIRALTGGDVKLGKAGVARVDLGADGTRGRLLWLVPTKISTR